MSKAERNGERKRRDIRRNPRLGYYIIITDTKETEKNYFEGLKKSFSIELQKHIVIQVKKASTKDLVKTCLEEVSEDPQYRHENCNFSLATDEARYILRCRSRKGTASFFMGITGD